MYSTKLKFKSRAEITKQQIEVAKKEYFSGGGEITVLTDEDLKARTVEEIEKLPFSKVQEGFMGGSTDFAGLMY